MADTAKRFSIEPQPQRRQTGRDTVEYDTDVLRPGNVVVPVRLVDLSANGFHARCTSTRFERGESIGLRLPVVGVVQARVMWGLRGCFGCQFLLPIDARTYLDLLGAVRAAPAGDSSPR